MRRAYLALLIYALFLQCLLPLFGVAHAAAHLDATQRTAATHTACHESTPAQATGHTLHHCCSEGRCHCASAAGASALPLSAPGESRLIRHEPAVTKLRTALAPAHGSDRLRPPIRLLPA
jgi:hypothetical protein